MFNDLIHADSGGIVNISGWVVGLVGWGLLRIAGRIEDVEKRQREHDLKFRKIEENCGLDLSVSE